MWVEPKEAIQVDSVPLAYSNISEIVRKESGDTIDTCESNGKTWESSTRMNSVSLFQSTFEDSPNDLNCKWKRC